MTDEPAAEELARRRRIDAIFAEALELPAAERTAFVERGAAGDASLAAAVLRLLELAGDPGSGLAPGGALSGSVWNSLAAERTARPERVGPYQLVEEIGRGGMAVVWLGERAEGDFRQRVAIKLIQGGLASRDVVERFGRERAILASLNHPAIAQLFDGGTTADGHPWFAMEYVEGEPIDRYCETRGLPIRERLELFLVIAHAVQYAHRNLVVHRDLKPSNILVTADGRVKLLDFGIAKLLDPAALGDPRQLTMAAMRPMTPHCASPEQLRGERITTASDVYQLGLLLYQLLTGRYPYRVDTRDQRRLAQAICEEPPTPPSTAVTAPTPDQSAPVLDLHDARRLRKRLRGDLDNIVLMALRKEPERRYGSVDDLAEDLRRHLRNLPVRACRDTVGYRMRKFADRHARGLAITTAVAIMFIALIAFYTSRLAEQRDLAVTAADKAQRTAQVLYRLFETADPELGAGAATTARELLDRGAAQITAELSEQKDIQADAMDTIGGIYTKLGLYDEADAMLSAALANREAESPPQPLALAATLDALGRLRAEQYRFVESAALHERALALLEQEVGADDLRLAPALDRIAVDRVRRRDFDSAVALLDRAVAIRSGGDPHDPGIAELLVDRAWLEDERGSYAAAQSYAEQAIAIVEAKLGLDEPRLHRALFTLARALEAQGVYAQATAVYQRDLEITSKAFGRSNARVGDILINLAFATRSGGELETSLGYAQQAVEVRARLYGREHPSYATALVVLADSHAALGAYGAAEPLLVAAIAIYESGSEPNPIGLSFGLAALADIHVDTERYPSAIEGYERALAIRSQARGAEHPDIAHLLTKLGAAQSRGGRLADARDSLQRALPMTRKFLPADHPRIADIELELANLMIRAGDRDAAYPLLTDGLRIREATLAADDPRVAQARGLLGFWYLAARRYPEARPLLLESYRTLAGQDSPETREILEHLAEYFDAVGEPGEARRYRSELSALRTST
jgi:serine/threonine-protein kinase